MQDKKRAIIEKSKFFQSFKPSIVDAILPVLNENRFAAGRLVCQKGERSDCLYIISEGTVEISVSSKDGKVIVLGTLGAGNVFGEVGLLDGSARTANVEARTDVVLYRLDSANFDKLAKEFGPAEWRAMASYVCALFRDVTANLEETAFLDTDVRILKRILELHEKAPAKEAQGNSFKLNMSQENLGQMVGLSREATNRALVRLSRQGLIERRYKKISVPDIERLRAYIAEEEG